MNLYLNLRNNTISASALALQVSNARDCKEYKDAKDWLIDTTMSCNLEEAKKWMIGQMGKTIEEGFATKTSDILNKKELLWNNRCTFLAAYDLYEELSKSKA